MNNLFEDTLGYDDSYNDGYDDVDGDIVVVVGGGGGCGGDSCGDGDGWWSPFR